MRDPEKISISIPWIFVKSFIALGNAFAFFAFVAVVTLFVKFIWRLP